MNPGWVAATLVAFVVGLLSPPLTWAQVDDKPFGIEQDQALEAARLAQETAQKAALAEWILGREEAAAGRVFDPAFRAAVKAGLTSSLSLAALTAQTQQSGLGPLNLGEGQADLVYTPVTPCRILDTRLAGGPIPAGTTRDVLVTGDTTAQGGANCGIPFGPATAAVLNFVAVGPAGPGDLRVTPFGTAMPNASIVNYAAVAGLNIANGLVVTLCFPATTTCTQDITLQADVSATDVVADVQGYFRKTDVATLTTYLTRTIGGLALDIDTAPILCQTAVYAPTAPKRARVDSWISLQAAGGGNMGFFGRNVLSTDAGASFGTNLDTAATSRATAIANEWAHLTNSATVDLNAGTSYVFAIQTGRISGFPTNASQSRCEVIVQITPR